MTDDVMVMPESPYKMRLHLAGEHYLPTSGLAWVEMAAIHTNDHLADVGHTHEKPR